MNANEPRGGRSLVRTADGRAQCPLCAKLGQEHTVFKMGILGWDKHIAAWVSHPEWHPDVKDPKKRKEFFKREFPDFIALGLTTANTTQRRAVNKEQKKRKRALARQANGLPPLTRNREPKPEVRLESRREAPPPNGRLATPGVLVERAPAGPVALPTAHGAMEHTMTCPMCRGSGRVGLVALPNPTMSPTDHIDRGRKSP